MAKEKHKLEGLGDVVASITDAVGINKCEGCEKRRNFLNNLFPFHRVKPMNEEQESFMKDIIQKIALSKEEWKELYAVFNDTFNTELNYCEGCEGQNKNVLEKLTKLYNSK